MLLHYFKIAFRNMWKYRSQTLISLLGLAVGFTCFSLATLWIRYEMTYDSFHKNAKQMYIVYSQDRDNPSRVRRSFDMRWANYLKETFPEIAAATTVKIPSSREFKMISGGMEDGESPAIVIYAERSFPHMFDVKLIEGNWDCFVPDSWKIAITQEKARRMFGEENPIGKRIGTTLEISAVVSGISGHSNFVFDFIYPPSNTGFSGHTVIELYPGTDVEAFERKLYEHTAGEGVNGISKLRIMPVTKLHYSDPDIIREVKFEYIVIFAISGLLVILCSLFNYLTLFVSRFRIRQKELALRMVCGASGRSLLEMLTVEFILTLTLAVAVGCVLTLSLYEPFLQISYVSMDLSAIYHETLLYIGGVMLISMFVLWVILYLFRRRSLNLSIRRGNKKLFSKASIVSQLTISIGFAFCALIIVKQIYFLYYSGELGLSFKNRATLNISFLTYGSIPIDGATEDVFINQLRQIPEITEILSTGGFVSRLNAFSNSGSIRSYSWDDKPEAAEFVDLLKARISTASIAFFDLQLVAGEMMNDADPESAVMINEDAVKAFGWQDPVGKQFIDDIDAVQGNDGLKTVKGVIKNIYYFAPTEHTQPTYYRKPELQENRLRDGTSYYRASLSFKYIDGMWESCKEKINQLIKKEYPEVWLGQLRINNIEEEYKDYLKSENALLRLLSVVSGTCILICVFGFVSLVSLTCEERRKSIAIRKINGATVEDIISIFAKEYALLLLIGAVIAFSTGFFIMQRWLEQYAIHTNIPLWLYLSILFVMALVIVLCVGWQVYKTSIEDPAEVMKRDN